MGRGPEAAAAAEGTLGVDDEVAGEGGGRQVRGSGGGDHEVALLGRGVEGGLAALGGLGGKGKGGKRREGQEG